MSATTIDIDQQKATGARERLAAFFELTKPRIAFMLVLTSAAAFFLASKGNFDLILFVHSMVGITLLAFGVAALNQYLERATDPLMKRTSARPLPTGRVMPTEALVFGLGLCLAAELYMLFLVNAVTALLGMAVIIGYVLLYTPLKRHTTACTAIGAIPGALPPLMGWTAAANSITLEGWSLFTILFLWQFPHFLAIAWLYREEYRGAGIKMLPAVEEEGRMTAFQIAVFALMLLISSLSPYFLGFAGPIFLIGAFIIGAWFLLESIRMAYARDGVRAKRLLLASVIYLPLFFLLAVIDSR